MRTERNRKEVKGSCQDLVRRWAMERKRDTFQMLKTPGEMEEKFWCTKDNCYNDWKNMLQMDSMNFKGKKKDLTLFD